jgi:hypothetical protein
LGSSAIAINHPKVATDCKWTSQTNDFPLILSSRIQAVIQNYRDRHWIVADHLLASSFQIAPTRYFNVTSHM